MLAIIFSLISLSHAFMPLPASRKEMAVGQMYGPGRTLLLDIELYFSDNACQVQAPGFMSMQYPLPDGGCIYDYSTGNYVTIFCQPDGTLIEHCYAGSDPTCTGQTISCSSTDFTVYYTNGKCVTEWVADGIDPWTMSWGPGVCDVQTQAAVESKVGEDNLETFLESILYSSENSNLTNVVNLFALIGVASIVAFAYKRMTKKTEFQTIQESDNNI